MSNKVVPELGDLVMTPKIPRHGEKRQIGIVVQPNEEFKNEKEWCMIQLDNADTKICATHDLIIIMRAEGKFNLIQAPLQQMAVEAYEKNTELIDELLRSLRKGQPSAELEKIAEVDRRYAGDKVSRFEWSGTEEEVKDE